MSITVVEDKGVTVVTVASDSNSMLPPLCQILKSLCYSPVCCSVHRGLMQSNVVSGLGAVQIMVGLFNIALGPGRTSHHPEDFAYLRAAYWLGAVYLAAGIISVLADRFPCVFSVRFAVFMNVVGSIFSIIGIVLYAMDLGDWSVSSLCDEGWHDYPSDDCRYAAYYFLRLLKAMDITMISLAAIHLCVCVSLAVLGINALLNRRKGEGHRDVEIYQPLPTKDPMTSPCA